LYFKTSTVPPTACVVGAARPGISLFGLLSATQLHVESKSLAGYCCNPQQLGQYSQHWQ
jgi:hypothetical protein